MTDAGLDLDDEVDEVDEGNQLVGGISRNVLEYVAKAIVDDAESVVVEVEESRNGISLRLNVSPDDMGRVIGRRGRTAQAIRTVVRAAAAREGLDAHVDISD
jgi:predicted RNA-binding protein YlqC (UPF0109 family)